MNKKVEYLPLGSVVVLNGGIRKYVIISRGIQVKNEEATLFFDYGACSYPEGMMGEQVIYFQHKDIKEVIYKGYSDHDEELMVENIQNAYEKMGLTHTDVVQMKERMLDGKRD